MTAAHQMPLFDSTRDGGEAPIPAPAPAPAVEHDDPAALALEIATDLREAEVAIAGDGKIAEQKATGVRTCTVLVGRAA